MPGSPPTTTRLGLPRYAQTDAAQFSPQVNAIVDALDPITARTDDTRFTNARTPTAHATTHQPGGSDAMAVDAAAATASLRTLGTGASQAAAGNDVRLRGADFASISGAQIRDVGVVGQIRAGRQLTVADFTNLGLVQPIGLWNLSDLTNLGSDGQALGNKNAVTFGVGINGSASTAAIFRGASGIPANDPALYIAGANAANYNIKTGSWGCWFRTAKRATSQDVLSKWSQTAGQQSWLINVGLGNQVLGYVSTTGSDLPNVTGVSDVADDRWHHAVITYDGTALRLYVDGIPESVASISGAVFSGSAPLNVAARAADAATATGNPFYGRVDEAFVTGDVLSEDQIRCLYAAKLTHTLGVAPTAVRLNVLRRRKGAPLVVGDFTTTPLRLYNFTAADLAGAGSDTSGNRLLTNNGTALSVAGADGTPGGAFSFAGAQSLSATDAGLPNLLTTRSYGCWFKTTSALNAWSLGWGTSGSNATAGTGLTGTGAVQSVSGTDVISGPFVADGQWHLAVAVEDNAAGDGVRRKLYLDGRLVGGSTVLNSITLAGANAFRVGATPTGTLQFTGQIDTAFVTNYALTPADVAALYAKGAQDLGPSPKNAGDHVERMSSTDLLFIGDTLESQHTVDLGVMA
jgi:hypothetical protein